MKEEKSRKNWVLWLVIALLLLALVYKDTTQPVTNESKLGNPGTEYFNQEEPEKKDKKELGKIGVSIPACLTVQDEKALITITNTGQQAYVPYTLAEGREIYRASKIVEPGEKVSAVIPVGTAKSCVTYVETLHGEKFSVTTKLVR